MTRSHALLLLSLVACGDATGPSTLPPGAVITVFPANVQILPGDTFRLTATITDSLGVPIPGATVGWASSNENVARVNQSGLVTGLILGNARIVAFATPTTGSANIVVVPPVDSIAIVPVGLEMVVGGGMPLTARMFAANGSLLAPRSAAWSSSDTGVAVVDSLGLVTGRAVGLATISAQRDGATGTLAVTVRQVQFVGVSASAFHHTCAVTNDSRGFCWGENASGQTGSGVSGGRQVTPLGVALQSYLTIATGERFTCGLVPSGAAFCWGEGGQGRLGTGDSTDRPTPRAVATALAFSALATGREHGCAVHAATGAAYCWGSPFGNGRTFVTLGPQLLSGGQQFFRVSAGDGFSCGLAVDSTSYCWGYNFDGALGDSTTISRATPAAVHGGLKYTALAAKHEHACAIAADSAAYCWGRNFLGELGTGDTVTGRRLIPTAVVGAGGLKFASITAGSLHTCAVTTTGAAYCWGYGGEGQLGSTPTDLCGQFPCSPSPQPVAGGHSFAMLAAGNSYTCGITVGGVTYCWGTSGAGALGADAVLQSQTPVRVVGQP